MFEEKCEALQVWEVWLIKMKLIAFLCLLGLSACSNKTNLQTLNVIHQAILENHPGMVNPQDSQFAHRLEVSYEHARKSLSHTRDYHQVIETFVKSFEDSHLYVDWSTTTMQVNAKNEDNRAFNLMRLTQNVTWVTLPTFEPNTKQEKQFDALVQSISQLKNTKYIVFDLRGNAGGNSQYGNLLTDALFGKAYAENKRCLLNQHTYVDWRASEGNLKHIIFLESKYPQSAWLKTIEVGLKNSLSKQKPYYREYRQRVCNKKISTKRPSALTEVFVIIDSQNVSAVLDFIDELQAMSTPTVLIGEQTKADRLYMEIRPIDLPNNTGRFFLPIKVYRNRARLDKQPYVPNIQFKALDDTAALQKFVLKQVRHSALES